MTQPNKLLDRTFHAGITLKGLGGLTEIIGGILLWYVPPASMSNFVQLIFLQELSLHPNHYLSSHLREATERMARADPTFASFYLVSHGVIKAVLVVCLWLNMLWAFPVTIGVFSAFCVYQMHRYMHTHSILLILITVFDIFLIYLTWREYLQQMRLRREEQQSPPPQPRP